LKKISKSTWFLEKEVYTANIVIFEIFWIASLSRVPQKDFLMILSLVFFSCLNLICSNYLRKEKYFLDTRAEKKRFFSDFE